MVYSRRRRGVDIFASSDMRPHRLGVRTAVIIGLALVMVGLLWPDSRIARGDLAEEIDALRRELGGDIMVHGGATFVQALSQRRLIDEYRLVIRLVTLGGASAFVRTAKVTI
jgi:dihydrofolate reductase